MIIKLAKNAINILKYRLSNDDIRRLFENISSLFLLRVINYILPLITVPYLVRVLGIEKYGIVAFAMSFTAYFQILTDYGFNFTATREISINCSNKEKVSEVFSTVFIIKIIFLFISFLLLCLIVFNINSFKTDLTIYIIAFGTVIGNTLFPSWLFQGIQKMKYITYINLIGKTAVTISVFVVIKKDKDYLIYVILNSLSYIAIGIISMLIALKLCKVRFVFPSLTQIKTSLKDGWNIFMTSMLSSIISVGGTFVLGLFQSKEIVGYYAAIDKLVKAFIGLFLPITQAAFPYISAKFSQSYIAGRRSVIKLSKYTVFLAGLIALILYIFNKDIIFLVFGTKFIEHSVILKYLSIWLLLGVLNNIIGIQYLVASGRDSYYTKSFIIASFITLMLYLFLVGPLSYYGVIIGMIIGEFILTCCMLLLIKFKTVSL